MRKNGRIYVAKEVAFRRNKVIESVFTKSDLKEFKKKVVPDEN